MKKHQIVLIICDGLGYSETMEHNAVFHAETPHLDAYWKECPHALLQASGEGVGLPDGQMGTSEANHLVIGAGRILYHNLVKINQAVEMGGLNLNGPILSAIEHAKMYKGTLHIIGMLSPGGVHGHMDHLKALVTLAKNHGLSRVSLHLFTDGRDVAPKSALGYLEDFEAFLNEVNVGRIVSIGGRYWGMDRDQNADRIEKHFKAMCGEGRHFINARDVIIDAYENNVTDEFIEPAIIDAGDQEDIACIRENDAIITANFRADRARQLTKRILEEKDSNIHHIAMTKYDDELDVRVAFPPDQIHNTLSEVVSRAGLKQLRVTETEKFTHLTFFLNAQKYEPDPGEDRVMIPSDKSVRTYDEKPEMRAKEIAERVAQGLDEGYDFIATNLVNCDMVGHTGNFEAIKKGVHAVDKAIGHIVEAAKKVGADVIITADHGNAEQVFDTQTNQALTSHTLNPVPCILVSNHPHTFNRSEGLLSDIAPTILTMLDLEIPVEMTGKSLV